ncbi:MAG: DNA-protecting protein DprA [Actinomycetota bacterium]|nr:DNA-protecting protein DprA [Actinomycetota bacterium]
MSASDRLPAGAFAASLASLNGIGSDRLRNLLAQGSVTDVWQSIVEGHPDDQDGSWRRQARRLDVASVWHAHRAHGIDVLTIDDARYPTDLASDSDAPPVLFIRGTFPWSDGRPRVAVVGTRSATRYGLGIAAQLGADLTAAHVATVSGLALGIDGAAHEGAVAAWTASAGTAARPIGVVAGGLDRPYPQAHSRLWERVARAGALLSESPVGAPTPPWRFPMRNRLIAALSDVVVVVESHLRGGALSTALAADRRGIPVGAVPGSVRSPASAGTNGLIADGCFVVRDVTDVLVAVELARAHDMAVRTRHDPRLPPARATSLPVSNRSKARGATRAAPNLTVHDDDKEARAAGEARPARPRSKPGISTASRRRAERSTVRDSPSPSTETLEHRVLDALGWDPCSLEDVLRRTDLPLGLASEVLERLRHQHVVDEVAGWWERC